MALDALDRPSMPLWSCGRRTGRSPAAPQGLAALAPLGAYRTFFPSSGPHLPATMSSARWSRRSVSSTSSSLFR